MSKFFFPLAVLAWVLALAFVLVFLVVLTSPDTHLHLGEFAEHHQPDERAALIFVPTGSEQAAGVGAEIVRSNQVPSGEAVEAGRLLFQTAGCARCHGTDGQGGPVAPPLANSSSGAVQRMVRDGPGGMPAYTEAQLSDTDLDKLADYLRNLPVVRPNSAEIAAIQRLTWDPSISTGILLQGKAAVRRSCGACHTQPTAEEIRQAFTNDFDATSLVAAMVSQTNLSVEDARVIAYYMLAILNGRDPVKAP